MGNKYWFKPKLYGYGFTPISWEGWLVTLGLVAILMLSAFSHEFFTVMGPSYKQAAGFLFDIALVVVVFTVLCIPKTQGELKWNWGKRR